MNFRALSSSTQHQSWRSFAEQLQDDVCQVQFTARSHHAPSQQKESEG